MSKRKLQKLEQEREALEARLAEKQGQASVVAASLGDLVAQLLDAEDGQRPALIQRRVELVAERGALADEIIELARRRDVVHLAYYELQEAMVQAQTTRLQELATQARRELTTALNERRRFRNVERGQLAEAEGDKRMLELEVRIAELQARARVTERDARRAGYALDRARAETNAVRQELEASTGHCV